MFLEEKGHDSEVGRISKHKGRRQVVLHWEIREVNTQVALHRPSHNISEEKFKDKSASGFSLVRGSTDFCSFIAQILHVQQGELGFKAAQQFTAGEF